MVLAYVHYSTVNRVLALFYFGLRPEVRAMKTIIKAAQEEDAGKTIVKEQTQVGANLDLKI